MTILDGKKIAAEILSEIQTQVAKLPFQPVFCDILVGNNPASQQYVKMKENVAQKVGFKFRSANFSSTISETQLLAEIMAISNEPDMCGLIVQLPLPASVNKERVLNAIAPAIDVDSTGRVNTQLFYSGRPAFIFPTAAAVMELLKEAGADFKAHSFVVIGAGQLVGRPVEFLLRQAGAKVAVVRSETPNAENHIKQADVIISAAGSAGLLTGDKIKNGCIVIDAGTSEAYGTIAGDADFESVKKVVGVISPVPGGVGPVTVAMLMRNVLTAAQQKIK